MDQLEDWRQALEILPDELIQLVRINKVERQWTWPNGSVTDWRSADREGAMRGPGWDDAFVDECSGITEDSWRALQPALAKRSGRALLASTPKGKHTWFWAEHEHGRRDSNVYSPDYESWHFRSVDSPFFPKAEYERARRDYPADWFAQEYEGLFLDEAAAVFRGVDAVLIDPAEIEAAAPYVLGIDLAKHEDFTVCAVMSSNGHLGALNRWNQATWPTTKARLLAIGQQYGGHCVIDSTGVGEPVYEDLYDAGLDVEPYTFTNESKQRLIVGLQLAIEQKRIRIGTDQRVLVDELRNFGYEMLPSGKMRYEATRGHDDCVIALALAVYSLASAPRPHASRMTDGGHAEERVKAVGTVGRRSRYESIELPV